MTYRDSLHTDGKPYTFLGFGWKPNQQHPTAEVDRVLLTVTSVCCCYMPSIQLKTITYCGKSAFSHNQRPTFSMS